MNFTKSNDCKDRNELEQSRVFLLLKRILDEFSLRKERAS